MDSKANLKLDAAMYLAVNAAPYWRDSLHALTMVETEQVPVMGVDNGWRCYYNPKIVSQWPTAEVAYVLIHEVSHLLRDHATRCKDSAADHDEWNEATDLEINCAKWTSRDDYGNETVLPLPKCGLHPSKYGWPENLLAEEYLPKLRNRPKPPGGGGKAQGKGKGGSGGQQQPGQSNGKPSTGGSCSDGVPRPWELPEDDEQHPALGEVEQVAKRIQAAQEMEKHLEANGRGTLPAGWEVWCKTILTPKSPWKRLVRNCVATGVARCGLGRQTYMRSRRRGNLIFPRHKMPQPVIAIVADTSGSMGQGEGTPLQRAFSEVIGIVKCVGQVNVVWTDAVGTLQRNVRRFSDIKPVGGGGTDMRVGIKHALGLRGGDRPDMIITVTDGETPWEMEAPSIPHVAVIVKKNTFYPEPKFGKVIRIED